MKRMGVGLAAFGAAVVSCAVVSCRSGEAARHDGEPAARPVGVAAVVTTGPATAPATWPAFAPIADQSHLPNAHVVTSKVISGAQPEGDEGFETLRVMGIKTIVSVDGSRPDVERAHKFGMTYVHLPITYSGVKPEEGRAIAKALTELPGPIYIHCHHGQHRSAAAVAVACVENGTLPPERAESVLQTFGTGANYKGLWRAAREARPVPPEELRDLKVEFVETKKLPPLADAMVGVDERFDHIKAIQKAGWRAPANHPDLDPPHEALQLEETFRELGRNDHSHAGKADFARMLWEAEANTRALRTALAGKPVNTAGADAAFKRVAGTCASCHKDYRN